MSRDLRICDQERTESNREIRICDERASRAPSDIVICDLDCGPPLEIVAPDQISPGQCFTVRGGKSPYAWDSSGNIEVSDAGCIISVSSCDFMVTVSDACGQSASFVQKTTYSPCPDGYSLEDISLSGPDPLANGTYQINGAPVGAKFIWLLLGTGTMDVAPDTLSAVVSGIGGCETVLTVESVARSSLAWMDGEECATSSNECWTAARGYQAPPLTISGTDAPSVGSGYSASGGVAPYTWSISCGGISDTGQITSLSGCCGSGSVTVTDACGNSASMAVRFPTGQWVETSRQYGPCGDLSYKFITCGAATTTCQKISGGSRTTYTILHQNLTGCVGGLGCNDCTAMSHISSNPCTGEAYPSMQCDCGNGCGRATTIHQIVIEGWQCP